MRAAIFFWWFIALTGSGWQALGPFENREECAAVRLWISYLPDHKASSECWFGKEKPSWFKP